jgi:hypothetical protein
MTDAIILMIVKAMCLAIMIAIFAAHAVLWMVLTPAAAFAELLLWLSRKAAP